MQRRGLVATACAVVLVLAGLSACGDDGEDTLTKEEFVEQANAICSEGNAEISSYFEGLSEESPEAELEEAVERVADNVEGQVEDIRDLEEPEELSDEVEAALDSADADLEDLRASGAAALESEDDPFAETNELLADIGLTTCAEG